MHRKESQSLKFCRLLSVFTMLEIFSDRFQIMSCLLTQWLNGEDEKAMDLEYFLHLWSIVQFVKFWKDGLLAEWHAGQNVWRTQIFAICQHKCLVVLNAIHVFQLGNSHTLSEGIGPLDRTCNSPRFSFMYCYRSLPISAHVIKLTIYHVSTQWLQNQTHQSVWLFIHFALYYTLWVWWHGLKFASLSFVMPNYRGRDCVNMRGGPRARSQGIPPIDPDTVSCSNLCYQN